MIVIIESQRVKKCLQEVQIGYIQGCMYRNNVVVVVVVLFCFVFLGGRGGGVGGGRGQKATINLLLLKSFHQC